MTTLRDKAIDVVRAGMNRASEHDEEVVDVLLAAGMLTDPEEGDRLAAKAWRRARDVADGKPLAQRDGEARIERAARAMFYDKFPDGSDALWEHLCAGFLRSARAALAAADKEEKP